MTNQRSRRHCRPRLERLEDRTTPVVIDVVTPTAASGLAEIRSKSASATWNNEGKESGTDFVSDGSSDGSQFAAGKLAFTATPTHDDKTGISNLTAAVGLDGVGDFDVSDAIGSGIHRGDPITLKFEPDAGESVGDPIRVTLDAQAFGVAGQTNIHGSFTAGYKFDNESARLINGNYSGTPSQHHSVSLAAKVGDSIEVDFHLDGVIPASTTVADGAAGLALSIKAEPAHTDLIAKSLAWDPKKGGLTFQYTVDGNDLPAGEKPQVELFWAHGTSRIGDPIKLTGFTASGTAGTHSFNVPGKLLRNAPRSATGLVLVLDRQDKISESNEHNNTVAVKDVSVKVASGAVGPFTAFSRTVVNELLREAGQKSATITSLYRPPAKQAQVMFNNCLSKGVASQKKLYKAAGQEVIQVYADKTKGLTKAKIVANKKAIIKAMLDKINEVGPYNVSHHCADPKVRQVIDLDPKSFAATAGDRFLKAAKAHPKVDHKNVFGPRNGDPAYHIEIPQT